MPVEIFISLLDPSQLFTSVVVAIGSIILRQYLSVILGFLANLLVLIIIFVVFLLSILVFGVVLPAP